MEECIYCNALVEVPAEVPALDDDEDWGEAAAGHSRGCEWVLTRAHRVSADVSADC